MKLRINAKLKAAVIAAITAVGFTLTQAQATDLNEVMTMSSMVTSATVQGQGAKASTIWEIKASETKDANVVYDFDGSSYLTDITGTGLFDALTGSSYVTVAAWINPTSHEGGAGSVEKGDGGAIFGFGGQSDGIKVIDNSGSLKATTKGKADFNNAKASGIDTTADTWQLVAVTYHIDGNNVQACTMVGSTISAQQTATNGMVTPNPQTLAIGSANNNKARELFQGSIAALTVFTSDNWVTTDEVAGAMYAAPTKIVYPTQTWDGTSQDHAWSDSVWVSGGERTVFNPQNVAEFTSTGHNVVSITTAASANNINVGGQNYTFDLSNGGSLTTGTLTVTSDQLALTGEGTVKAATITASDKTINIGENVVLQGGSTDVAKLSGTGTYALASGTKALGSVFLNNDWTGYVRIGGVAFSNDNLDSMARSGAAGIEMAGIASGYVNGWNGGTVHAKVRLTNPSGSNDNIAWKWSDGTSADKDGNYPTITFDGAWDGSGTLQLTDKRQCFTYSGDISNWNGAFDYRGNHGTKLTFTGNATTVNAAILNNGTNDANKVWKQFHLIVQNEAEFSKDVAAYTLEVAVGASATFQGDATFNSLSGTGKVALDKDAKLTVSGTVADTVTIDAADGAVIDAELAPTQVGIAADATATFMQGIQDASGVEFLGEEGVQVKNTNDPVGGSAINYSVGETAAQVTADTMTVDGTEGVEVYNSLVVDEIVNNNAGGLVLKGNVDGGVTLNAAGGDIILLGQTGNTVSVVDLNIAENNTVTLMDGESYEEGTVTVSGVLTGGSATLYANLTILGGEGSMLDVNGGGDAALTLGSELTVDTTNGLINLDPDTIAALNGLGTGETLNLIVAADKEHLPLTYGGQGYDGMGYSDLFNRVDGLEGNYTVYARDDAFGVTKQGAVPEPTTGTLSLLALMALAARRRRK